jgi:hypothetical protein
MTESHRGIAIKDVIVNLPPSDVQHIPGLGFDELVS